MYRNPVSRQVGSEIRNLEMLDDPHSGLIIDDKTSEMSIKEYIPMNSSDPLSDILAKFNSRTVSFFGVQLRFTYASGEAIGIPVVGAFVGHKVPTMKKFQFLGAFTRVHEETQVHENMFIDGLDDDLLEKACEIGRKYDRTPIVKYNGKALVEVQGKYRYK